MINWEISIRPEGRNEDGKNEGGVVILLKQGNQEAEVGRVAFERSNSLHPEVKFEDQLQVEVGKAATVLNKIRELNEGAGQLQ